MIAEIPLQVTANQELLIILERQNCSIRLIQRNKKMYLSLWIDENEVWSGFICHDRLPLAQSRTYDFYGNLVFVDLEGSSDPVYTGLGTRWKLFYYTPDEPLPEWFQTLIIDLKGV